MRTTPMSETGACARRISDGLERVVGWGVIAFGTAMVFAVMAGIASRTVRHPLFWTEELARHTMIWSALLGSGIALKRGMHIGITLLLKRFRARTILILDIFSRLCITVFLAAMTWYGIRVCFVVASQDSPTMGYSMAWLFAVTPVTCALNLVFLALMTIEHLAEGYHEGSHISMLTPDHDFE